MKNYKDDLTCNFTNHILEMISDNSFEIDDLYFNQYSTNFSIDSQKYISEVKSLLEYFYKIKYTYINRKLVYKIFNNFEFSFVFYYYQDSLFDVSILLKYSKYPKGNITRKEEFFNLNSPLNSSILSKTLEKGSQIKELTFSNTENIFNFRFIYISFSTNTVTINWCLMNLFYLNLLLELWSGLILRLEHLKDYGKFWDLDLIQRFLSYCGRSPPYYKLSFSKVVIDIDIDMLNYRFIESYEKISKLKHLCDSLSKFYDVEFENITYEDLFVNGF